MPPPSAVIVGISGTTYTIKPYLLSSFYKVFIAIVFPAQGPPVKHTRYRGALI